SEYDDDASSATACIACDSGYQSTPNRLACENINECAAGTDSCAQNCTDTPGSYVCSCNIGYTLAPNNLGCNANTYTVTLNFEDAVTPDTTLTATFDSPYGALPEPTHPDTNFPYTFEGWWTAPDGTGSLVEA